MKSLVYAVVAASAFAVPLASFAQSSNNGPVTRAQVRQELIQLEQTGYNPAARDPSYPEDIQAAQRRVDEQQGSAAMAAGQTSGYGGVAAGSSQSGSRVQVQPANPAGAEPVYFGQ
jgi:Ni/Co efflux regulator RcnB